MSYVVFNGEIIKAEEASVSLSDRGFRYGDGVFETMIVANRKIYRGDRHFARLARALTAVKISFDLADIPGLCRKLIEKNNVAEGLLRLQITRGVGGRGYLPEKGIAPTLLIETLPAPVVSQNPVSLWLSSYRKISPRALPVSFKLCQGLNSTLARIEASENNCFDALMLNENGHICETSSANIFWLKDGELYTPALECGAVEGSMRAAIIELWRGKLHEVKAEIAEIEDADAVFVTNTAWRVLQVFELKPLDLRWKESAEVVRVAKLLGEDVSRKTA